MHSETPAYGAWLLVIVNAFIFIIFAFSFTHPRTSRDWRSFGGFAAFVVALFTEMYGIPLTIYLLSGWLGSRFEGVNLFSHDSGHLWHTLLGMKGNPHFDVFHILSYIFIITGFSMLSSAWKVLYAAQREGRLAISGIYARLRHPQYSGFITIMVGFLLQWPTLITLMMFPILVIMYIRLAKSEEREALTKFGDEYIRYASKTPAFIPRIKAKSPKTSRAPRILGTSEKIESK